MEITLNELLILFQMLDDHNLLTSKNPDDIKINIKRRKDGLLDADIFMRKGEHGSKG